MTTFDAHAPGTPNWVDLTSPDVGGSAAFYTALFGWDATEETDEQGSHIYTMFRVGGRAVAGLGGQQPGMEGMPAIWNTYIATADADATAAAVAEAGGSVVMPPMPVMAAGRMAVFTDPTGAFFSVWEAGEHIGAEVGNVAGTYSWNEHLSRDVEAATAFYAAVFGWTYEAQDMGPIGTYHVIEGGENGGLGGLMAMPPEMPDMVPNHWAVYFTVDDLDAALETLRANGGQVVNGPMAIPGVGTTAAVHDPAGGSFTLMQPEG